jgi:DNA-binding NarL/FixJ family response regulator
MHARAHGLPSPSHITSFRSSFNSRRNTAGTSQLALRATTGPKAFLLIAASARPSSTYAGAENHDEVSSHHSISSMAGPRKNLIVFHVPPIPAQPARATAETDRPAPKVLALIGKGRSYRLIGRELGLSKNTVADIVKRARAAANHAGRAEKVRLYGRNRPKGDLQGQLMNGR